MSIYLYQIAYDSNSMPANSSGFLPFDVRSDPEYLKREMAHMVRFYDEIVSKGHTDNFYGLFSSKFYKKTGGLTPEDIKNTIFNFPDADIYLFNPFPVKVYRYINVWRQGEESHPNLINLANKMFLRAGFDFDASRDYRNSEKDTVYCNYWVAKKTFFDQFIPFVKHMDQTINNMPAKMRDDYFLDAKYKSKACFYPFIFERLISTYLVANDNVVAHPHDRLAFSDMLNAVEKSFMNNGGVEEFEKWESKQNSIDVIKAKTELVNKYVNPNLLIYYWRPIARLFLSIRKKFNILMMRCFIKKQFKS